MEKPCEQHQEIATTLAVLNETIKNLKFSFDEVKDKMCEHIHEGEKAGGVRERLTLLEIEVKALKTAIWWRVIVAGIIGGLIGSGSTEAIQQLVKYLMK